MTVPCTSCGEPLDEADIRCRVCGTLAPPLPGASVFADETEIGPSLDEAVPAWNDPTTVEPWAIPIRESRVSQATTDPDRQDLIRTVTYAVVAIAVLAGLVVLSAGVLTGGGGPEMTDTAATDADAVEDELTTDATTSTSAPATTSTSTSSTSTSSTTTSSTTTTPAAGATVPTLSSSFRSGWVAQLTSVPASAGSTSLESAFATVRSDAPSAVATRSDEWPSLQTGYWVIVAPGPFGSEDQVRSFCSSIGRSTDGCLPRMLADRR